jgi:hypothetical protein
MKKILSFSAFILLICVLYAACRKTQNQPAEFPNQPDNQSIIDDAFSYFHDSVATRARPGSSLKIISPQPAGAFNPTKQLMKSPLWEKAEVRFLTIGPVVVIPIRFDDSLFARPYNTGSSTRVSINKLSNLIVYTDMFKKKHAEVVLSLPDQSYIDGNSSTFSGTIFVTDWTGEYLRSYLYKKEKVWQLSMSDAGKNTGGNRSVIPTETADPVCTETDWYSCTGTVDDPFQYCTYTETTYTGCSPGGSEGTGGGTGQTPSSLDYGLMNSGGSSGSSVPSQFQFAGPKYPVMIGEEMNCFAANSTSSYSISINVEEPVPGSGKSITATLNVGHTYLTFEQENADGSKIVRNDGFYPLTSVFPWSPNDYGTFGENSTTGVSAVLKIWVSPTDFMTAVHNEAGQQSLRYNLYSYNCTTSALNVLSSIGINDLDQYAAGTLFTGNFPGNLGWTIRNLDLDVFSQLNGNRQMTRTLSGANNIMPPAKTGSCIDVE